MHDSVIKVEGLSKSYVIRHQAGERYTALRDVMANGVKRFGRKLFSPFAIHDSPFTASEEFFALKDVSFEVKQGERVGIIGRNGAGKSTLLKVLSRITEPTKGRVEITGRVASLLEVGTGFHPELTGRENIFLNGAILGMTRAEIRKKFDEIVSFAEIERFLDTPVKRYSSGMYVRLAFAVAAHLEPEILIVDEVLAVGDAQFQKKCLGKMEEVGREGRTVLFVSHNMGALRALCSRGLLLEKGGLASAGPMGEVIRSYTLERTSIARYVSSAEGPGPFFREISLQQAGENVSVVKIDRPFTVCFTIDRRQRKELVVSLLVKTAEELWVLHSSNEFSVKGLNDFGTAVTAEIPAHALAQGRYILDVSLEQRNYETFEHLRNVLVFDVEFAGAVSDRTSGSEWKGICGPGLLRWC